MYRSELFRWLLTQRVVHDPLYLKNLSRSALRVDYIGIGLIVVGIGFLQYVLDKTAGERLVRVPPHSGQLHLFPSSPCFCWSFASSPWKIPSWIFVCSANGISLRPSLSALSSAWCSTAAPSSFQNDLGYTAQLAGMALSPGGIALADMMPLAGILATKFDPRIIIAIGFAVTSFGLFHVTNIYLGVDLRAMVIYRVI